eukprot:CAMPEP_0179092850 /NCGR_PEP_ID=MMETSP0796-20121207/42487_1 /TAXON_ID=73915 /ORGANISM="Pyrodinium bahamense, Strain pbaha01" /LENGTH=186 /DNA_ID=CAMNT_0020790463 /DNA_START=277 /DNA_END=833 /DNA_ORIENTATION=+
MPLAELAVEPWLLVAASVADPEAPGTPMANLLALAAAQLRDARVAATAQANVLEECLQAGPPPGALRGGRAWSVSADAARGIAADLPEATRSNAAPAPVPHAVPLPHEDVLSKSSSAGSSRAPRQYTPPVPSLAGGMAAAAARAALLAASAAFQRRTRRSSLSSSSASLSSLSVSDLIAFMPEGGA